MSRLVSRLALPVALALLTLGSAAFARASLVAFDQFANAPLLASPVPVLLGPINELGRNGWQCKPEQAAKTVDASAAELPTEDGR